MSFIHYIVHPEGNMGKPEGFISEIEARNRAKELAAKLPGIEIIVMSTLAIYRNVPRVEEQKLEHMPEPVADNKDERISYERKTNF